MPSKVVLEKKISDEEIIRLVDEGYGEYTLLFSRNGYQFNGIGVNSFSQLENIHQFLGEFINKKKTDLSVFDGEFSVYGTLSTVRYTIEYEAIKELGVFNWKARNLSGGIITEGITDYPNAEFTVNDVFDEISQTVEIVAIEKY